MATTALTPVAARANPAGGVVAAGSAAISHPSPSNVTITQQSDRAIINWRSYNVGSSESVTYAQPAPSSVTLNRVAPGNPSTIAGQISANGNVFLVNPDGIMFTKTAHVDVNGLIATTHDISNSDFMAGHYNFTIPGSSNAKVVNEGSITAAQDGLVGLVAPWVRNDGVIQARLGRITLASGEAFTVDLYGDQLIQFALPVKDPPPASGTAPAGAAVTNTGQISADGGVVYLKADTARRIVDDAINTTGMIQADAVHKQGGTIVLDGGENGGVSVAGTVDAFGSGAGQTGGTVKALGSHVALTADAKINVSGDAGGGAALVGGNFHGAGPERNATTTTVAQGAAIDADATTAGNGGNVAVWSNDQTTFNGTITAHGGTLSGNGGFVETSGKQDLSVATGEVGTEAPHGAPGTWLLDPENVTIAGTGPSPTLPAAGDTTLSASADDSVLSASTIEDALKLGNVTVDTGTSGTQAGDIQVTSNIDWNGANSLTLSAFRNITVDDGVTIANVGAGNLSLRADNTGTGVGTINFNGTGHIDISNSTGTVSLFYNPPDNPPNSTINTISYTQPTDFSSAVSTNVSVAITPCATKCESQLTAYMLINTPYDLQDTENNLAGSYALGRDIDASPTIRWNGGAGFAPIGNSTTPFTGTLDGENHKINNLHIHRPLANDIGLFGVLGAREGTAIQNVDLVGGNVSGNDDVGFLVGLTGPFDIISNSYAAGSVSGTFYVGGLVGSTGTFSTIAHSAAAGSVSGQGFVGGLVGNNNAGFIEASHATGNVSGGGSYVGAFGGLIGQNSGTISSSYATGTVTGDFYVGGLVGFNSCCSYASRPPRDSGTITNSYATGNAIGASFVGGLVGSNTYGIVANDYAMGDATATGPNYVIDVGGLVGYDESALVTSGAFRGTGVGVNTLLGAITASYATGLVRGIADGNSGGLVGEIEISGYSHTISDSYWNTQTSNQTIGVGGTFGLGGAIGLTTAALQSGTLPVGLDPSVWTAKRGQYPILNWQLSTASSAPSAPTAVTFGGVASPPPPSPTPQGSSPPPPSPGPISPPPSSLSGSIPSSPPPTSAASPSGSSSSPTPPTSTPVVGSPSAASATTKNILGQYLQQSVAVTPNLTVAGSTPATSQPNNWTGNLPTFTPGQRLVVVGSAGILGGVGAPVTATATEYAIGKYDDVADAYNTLNDALNGRGTITVSHDVEKDGFNILNSIFLVGEIPGVSETVSYGEQKLTNTAEAGLSNLFYHWFYQPPNP